MPGAIWRSSLLKLKYLIKYCETLQVTSVDRFTVLYNIFLGNDEKFFCRSTADTAVSLDESQKKRSNRTGTSMLWETTSLLYRQKSESSIRHLANQRVTLKENYYYRTLWTSDITEQPIDLHDRRKVYNAPVIHPGAFRPTATNNKAFTGPRC